MHFFLRRVALVGLLACASACDDEASGTGGAGGSGGGGGQGGQGGEPALDPTSFRATGNMPVAVRYHRATLLEDGRVLISGGAARIDSLPLDQASSFDPASEKFTALDAMGTPRAFHTATCWPTARSSSRAAVKATSSGSPQASRRRRPRSCSTLRRTPSRRRVT